MHIPSPRPVRNANSVSFQTPFHTRVSPISTFALRLVVAAGMLLAPLPLPKLSAAAPPTATVSPVAGSSATWTGTAIGGASASESTCREGVNCDTFTLTVSGTPVDWAGKVIVIRIGWTIPTNDYDLYVHKDSNSGPLIASSTSGAPGTSEVVAIDPSSSGTGTYSVHTVYFSVAPGDQYQGSATVGNKPVAGLVTYLKGGITFGPSVTVKAPVAPRDGEPSSRTDRFGNHYVSGIRGVPAGVDLWYFDLQPGSRTYDPTMRNPIYRGQPDQFSPFDSLQVGADGGGDVDLAVGFDSPGNGAPPILATSSLVAANVSTQRSLDRGVTFQKNPLGSASGGVPVDDREWQQFFGSNIVYLLYRTVLPAVTQIQRSIDGGLTYGPATTAGLIGQVGAIDVDQNDGTVYISGSTGQVCTGIPAAPGQAPLTYTCTTAASDLNGVAHIFFIVKVAADGTVYVVYSNEKNIYLAHSTDKGATWSAPVRVSDGPETAISVFPAMATGPLPGSVGIAWYGTSNAVNNDSANWKVFYAQSFNAKDPSPTFRQVAASDHFIHASNISEGGTLGTANRNLLDYFQISFDPVGAAVIDYTDDHNDFDGHTYAMRQTSGSSINGGRVPAPVEGADLPEAKPLSADGSQVVDFPQDVAVALLGVLPVNDPLDILSVKYSCQRTATDLLLVAKMKVSDLSVIPPMSNWRMNFTANAPFSALSPTGQYSFALSDRGDQFYVRASTDPTLPTFSFGTAVRNSDGSITYTQRGTAESGSFDPLNNTITVKVSASKLNPFVTHGPAIATGSVLDGLRASTFTSDVNGKRDIARGGTQYTVGCPVGGGCTDGGSGGEAEGAGELHGSDGYDGRFSFTARGGCPGSGQMQFDEPATATTMNGNVDSATFSGNTAVISGAGRLANGTACQFTAVVSGNASPAIGADTFAITWITAKGLVFRTSGALTKGSIAVRPPL